MDRKSFYPQALAFGTIACTASGSASNLILTPCDPLQGIIDGMRFRWVSPFSGGINTGVIPGTQVKATIAGNVLGLLGPDGYTVCGIQDFATGGIYEATYVDSLKSLVIVSSGVTATQAKMAHGQCRFVASSSNTVNLHGYNGYGLLVRDPNAGFYRMLNVGGGISQRIDNGTAYIDGVGGKTLVNDTLYFAYAALIDGNLVIDFSTTGHGTDPNLGIEVKQGAGNAQYRTYVGMLYTKGGVVGPFTGGNGLCLCASWFNRQPLGMQTSQTSVSGVTGTSAAELSTDLRLHIVTHADTTPTLWATGYASNATQGKGGRLQSRMVPVAGEVVQAGTGLGSISMGTSSGANEPFALHSTYAQPIPEGYLISEPFGWVDAGTGSFSVMNIAQIWL